MNQKDFAKFQDNLFHRCSEIREKAQKEYAHDDARPFRNFEQLAAELGLPREKILWIYLKKHLDGILADINGHEAQREPIRGRVIDAINYLCLFAGMREEERGTMTDAEQYPEIFGEKATRLGEAYGR